MNQPAILLRTSTGTDVQRSGGILSIAGLTDTKVSRISSIVQIKGKAEVVQVKKVGGTAYTPTGSTPYTIAIGDTNRTKNGVREILKRYTYVTPANITDLGATTALQSEAIHAALITLINNDPSNFVAATTVGGGGGINITDDAGYYPPFSQTGTGRLGASTVLPVQNNDDTGFAATNVSTTTAAVYSSGLGADLISSIAITDAYIGGLISGYLYSSNGIAPKTVDGLTAVSGQIYDIFVIQSLDEASAYGGNGTQRAFVPVTKFVVVDNGTGSSTTNATGFASFEREMLRLIGDVYGQDPATIAEFFDNTLVNASLCNDGSALGTDNKTVTVNTGKSQLYYNYIGTATITVPIVTTNGLPLVLDATTQEGYELSAPNLTQCPKQGVVGKGEFSYYGRVNIGAGIAATSFKTFSFGLRKKAAYAVDQTAYEAASAPTVALGVPLDTGAAPVINIITGPGSAGALTNTSTAVTPTASQILDFYITVDNAGVAKFYVNGTDKTGLLAATYTFAAGTVLIPFVSTRNAAAASAAPFLVQELFLPSIWRA